MKPNFCPACNGPCRISEQNSARWSHVSLEAVDAPTEIATVEIKKRYWADGKPSCSGFATEDDCPILNVESGCPWELEGAYDPTPGNDCPIHFPRSDREAL